jgi:hypothetical protein
MSTTGLIVRAALVAGVFAALPACGKYGPHGDRGLPPAPADLAYPGVYRSEPDRHDALKSAEEQKRLQAELLARKPQRRARR